MDFIKKYRLGFYWGEFGDYFLYDKKANTSTLCQFVRVPKNKLPSISSLSIDESSFSGFSANGDGRHPDLPAGPQGLLPQPDSILDSPDFVSYSVASIKAVPNPTPSPKIPLAYQKLLQEFKSILTPNFKEVKHSIVHSIPTGDAAPVRSKARPLLPGSPKAIAGKKAWDELIESTFIFVLHQV